MNLEQQFFGQSEIIKEEKKETKKEQEISEVYENSAQKSSERPRKQSQQPKSFRVTAKNTFAYLAKKETKSGKK